MTSALSTSVKLTITRLENSLHRTSFLFLHKFSLYSWIFTLPSLASCNTETNKLPLLESYFTPKKNVHSLDRTLSRPEIGKKKTIGSKQMNQFHCFYFEKWFKILRSCFESVNQETTLWLITESRNRTFESLIRTSKARNSFFLVSHSNRAIKKQLFRFTDSNR